MSKIDRYKIRKYKIDKYKISKYRISMNEHLIILQKVVCISI